MKYNDHGDDRYLFDGVEMVADFSSNVPHLPYDEGLWKHLEASLSDLRHYPEPRAFTLERELSQRLRVMTQIREGCL